MRCQVSRRRAWLQAAWRGCLTGARTSARIGCIPLLWAFEGHPPVHGRPWPSYRAREKPRASCRRLWPPTSRPAPLSRVQAWMAERACQPRSWVQAREGDIPLLTSARSACRVCDRRVEPIRMSVVSMGPSSRACRARPSADGRAGGASRAVRGRAATDRGDEEKSGKEELQFNSWTLLSPTVRSPRLLDLLTLRPRPLRAASVGARCWAWMD